MPLLDFICDECGTRTERLIPLSQFDYAQHCAVCGAIIRQIMPRFPGVIAQFTASGRKDEAVYREHNATRTEDFTWGTRKPLSPAQGCTCGNCQAHVRRASVTSVAEPGKDR